MSYVSHFQTIGSTQTYSFNRPMNLCPETGRPVEIRLDLASIKKHFPSAEWYHPELPSMWRFGALLALDWFNGNDRRHIVSLGEGHTPLLNYADWPAAKAAGIHLWLKDEAKEVSGNGVNPTGSFKDRGMTMVVSMANHFNIPKLVVPTQGNAGDSLVTYGQEARLDVAVIMPNDTPSPILDRVATFADQKSNVHLEQVDGTIREAGQVMKAYWLDRGYFNVATFQEPGWRIEGKKTLGLEIAEPNNVMNQGKWQVPDVILYPTGGGTGILGMWKAFDELEALGLINSKRPRIYSIQAEQTQPVVLAFNGSGQAAQVEPGQTIATGLNVPSGVGHFRVLSILRSSKGGAIAVSEEAIKSCLVNHYRQLGSWLSPEGAAVLCGLDELIKTNQVKADETVVAVNTGAMEKYYSNPEAVFLK